MKAIKVVRDWLQSASGSDVINGHLIITRDYNSFRKNALQMSVDKSGLDVGDLTFNDHCLIVEAFLKQYAG